MNERIVVLLMVATLGCGGGSSTSGVQPSKPLSTLTVTEYGALCDWAADLYGGYGMRHYCTGTSYSAPAASRQSCLAEQPQFAHCAATVADLERCANAARERCFEAFGSSDCAAVVACGTPTATSSLHAGIWR